MNKRIFTATSRLVLSLACGFACGQLLFNQSGQKPYAGPAGALAATGLTAAVLSERKRRERAASSFLGTPDKSVSKPAPMPPTKAFAGSASALDANKKAEKRTPGLAVSQGEAKPAAKAFLKISFAKAGRPHYRNVSVWAYDFSPQADWESPLYKQLLQVGQVDWNKPRRNGPLIIQFNGKLRAEMPEEEFRQEVALPLLSVAARYNGNRPVESWLSFHQ